MAATGMGPGVLTVPAYQHADEQQYKTENGQQFRKGDYAYTPGSPSTWKLRLTNTPGGKPDPRIVGAAVAALGKGFRGQKVQIPSADLPAVKAKVRRAWRTANPDAKPEEMPPVLKARTDQEGVSPPGWEPTVEKMKGHPQITNPWALAWYMKNRGFHHHTDASFPQELTAALHELARGSMPALCLAAARGDSYAITCCLNDEGTLVPERRW